MKTPEEYLIDALEEHRGVPMPADYWRAQPVPAEVAEAALAKALADADRYREYLMRALRHVA